MPTIFSTLTSDNLYCSTIKNDNPDGVHRRIKGILIKGRSNTVDPITRTTIGPGVITEVSDKQLEFLRKDVVFQVHEKKGFITVIEKGTESASKVVKNMEEKDKSAPKTPLDYKVDVDPQPVVDKNKSKKNTDEK